MRPNDDRLNEAFEIFVGELITDDELRDSFLRDPERTLQLANDWALPLSDSELQSLKVPAYRLRDRVVDELELRLSAAA